MIAILLAAFTALAFAPPADVDRYQKIGRVKISYYWAVDESEYPASSRVAIRDVRGNVIARTSWTFRRHLLMEGSGRLRDGRNVTYQRHVNGEARFRITKFQWGAGIGECPLVPYRTLAVDPEFIRLGTRVFIPEFEGARLPDGTIHDGMFVAHDRSRYIRGARIDVFARNGKSSARPFIRKGYRSGSRVTVYRVAPPDPDGCHRR